MFSAFQTSGYQKNSYQILTSAVEPQRATPGYPTHHHWERIKQYRDEQEKLFREKEQNENILALKEKELLALERKRLKALQDEALQQQLVELLTYMAELEEQNRLLLLQIAFFLQEEEDVLILLMSLPFVN